MKIMIFVMILLSSRMAFAGNTSGWGGKPISRDVLSQTPKGEILLSPNEMLEALQNGLLKKPIIIERPGLAPIKLRPKNFDFGTKTIQLIDENGEIVSGKESLDGLKSTDPLVQDENEG